MLEVFELTRSRKEAHNSLPTLLLYGSSQIYEFMSTAVGLNEYLSSCYKSWTCYWKPLKIRSFAHTVSFQLPHPVYDSVFFTSRFTTFNS